MPEIKKIRVTARVDGFRRAGRAWSATPTDVLLSEFTEDQLESLKASQRDLIIEPVLDDETEQTEVVVDPAKHAGRAASTKKVGE